MIASDALREAQTFHAAARLLRRDALAQRGGDEERNRRGRRRVVPRSTVSDALELVALWSEALQHVSLTPVVLHRVRWRAVVADVVDAVGLLPPGDPFPGNPGLWRAVTKVARYCDAVRQGADLGEYRNAGFQSEPTVDVSQGVMRVSDVTDYAAAAAAIRKHYLNLRGPELAVVTTALVAAPRTTVADVLLVHTFWSEQARRGVLAAGLADWVAIHQSVVREIQGKKPGDVFPENAMFWRGVARLARHLDDAKKTSTPSRLEVAASYARSFGEGLVDAAGVALDLAGDAWGGFKDAASAATKEVGKVAAGTMKVAGELTAGAAKAASGFLHGITTPLIIGASLVIGAVILVPVLFRESTGKSGGGAKAPAGGGM